MALQDSLDESWREFLAEEFEKDYWPKLEEFVNAEREAHPGKIYPPEDEVFAALNILPLDKVKVVLIGQDPYHGPGQAHGLCFSVKKGVSIPPSLVNIYKELKTDLDITAPKHGNLTEWAERGILLLNTVLTVRHKEPNSHQKQGWEKFTDAIIKKLGHSDNPMVFILWGGKAKKKKSKIDKTVHKIIESGHPSPLSIKYFKGSAPFSKTNAALEELGKEAIDWSLTP